MISCELWCLYLDEVDDLMRAVVSNEVMRRRLVVEYGGGVRSHVVLQHEMRAAGIKSMLYQCCNVHYNYRYLVYINCL